MIYPDSTIGQFDHYSRPALYPNFFYSLDGGKLNIQGFSAGTHIVYRAMTRPKVYGTNNADTTRIEIPSPHDLTLILGGIAFEKKAMYSMNSNNEADAAMKAFEHEIEETLMTAAPATTWSTLDVVSPVMMR
ncbi:MAG: hypothetical protein E6Q97_16190 [Desulfurellales bacterium]|nr:MAG: hypothetical protein E6Q97_16190 [Desulfurellales bacterium]